MTFREICFCALRVRPTRPNSPAAVRLHGEPPKMGQKCAGGLDLDRSDPKMRQKNGVFLEEFLDHFWSRVGPWRAGSWPGPGQIWVRSWSGEGLLPPQVTNLEGPGNKEG